MAHTVRCSRLGEVTRLLQGERVGVLVRRTCGTTRIERITAGKSLSPSQLAPQRSVGAAYESPALPLSYSANGCRFYRGCGDHSNGRLILSRGRRPLSRAGLSRHGGVGLSGAGCGQSFPHRDEPLVKFPIALRAVMGALLLLAASGGAVSAATTSVECGLF